jgi:hypothetical protein
MYLMTGSHLCEKDTYHIRINIESAFGILVARWGILWKKMAIPLNTVPLVVSVCIKLHNLCRENNLEIFTHVDDACSENDSGPINLEAPDGPFSY